MSSPSAPNMKRSRLSASRLSLSGRNSLHGGQSTLPRPTAAAFANRLASTQPTYDFLTGATTEEAAPSLTRSTLRQSSVAKQDNGHDDTLRSQINTLKYDLDNVRQERSLLILQHERELRDVQLRAEADFKRAQAAESATHKTVQKSDILARELQDAKDQSMSEQASLGKRLRDLQEQNQLLRESAEDAQAQLSDQDRQYKYQINDVEAKRAALQDTVERMKNDLQVLGQKVEAAQERLSTRDIEVEGFEAQIAELRSHSGDSETLSVVQRELSDQVAHIRKLESTNREQLAELRRLRNEHKSAQVVEEQKRSLETELHVLKDVHRQLGEAQIQREILEDEKRAWTTLLGKDGQESDFDSPETVVRALVQERIEHASSIDSLGRVEAELSEKDELIVSLESEKAALKEALDKARTVFSSDLPESKAYKRLERQRVLAVKEAEYLRAQLKTFDTEETAAESKDACDAQKSQQIQELESLVDQYRGELQTLHSTLSTQEQRLKEAQQLPAADPPLPQPINSERPQAVSTYNSQQQQELRGTKRPALNSGDSSQLGHVLRKNKNLQTALAAAVQKQTLLNTELSATKSQIQFLTSKARTRILELRSNPTNDAEALKMSTLASLKAENQDLLTQLRVAARSDNPNSEVAPTGPNMLPSSVVDNLKLNLQEMEKMVSEKEKRMRRLKEIWTNKATEFRDLIVSVLGYKVDFMPNGKVRVTPTYYLNQDRDNNGDASEEYSIIFDGENGTMKMSGGPRSQFALEIKDLVKYWVQEKGQIPCFLAALTLECYDKNTRAAASL